MKIILKYDGEIDIAIGRSRKEVNWKNKTILWSDYLNRIKETHRTHETYSQYMGMKKAMQDDIKDVGGFVGGFLNGGRRKAENVTHRQLITLDIDFGDMSIWDSFKLLGYAGCIYSTHKHEPKNQRLRLVIPLDRPVSREEYEPIARRIADDYGIDAFDDTTYSACRLMYWPSTPKDGQYVFEYCDGEWMSADEILNSYRDWTDSSSWAISSRVDRVIHSELKKQEMPTDKKGIVGAFCRTYSISEAIEKFLSDEYDTCDIENRYSYKHGSTSAGLVVYDDLFAFSHHGTDPASGKLCNSFDLVRIHKFGLKDESSKEGTPANRMPSYVAMQEFATKDSEVKRTIVEERQKEALDDFSGMYSETDVTLTENVDWQLDFDIDAKSNILATPKNIKLIMENDPNLKGCFARDTFTDRKVLRKLPPWRKKDDEGRFLKDSDESYLRIYLSEKPWNIQARGLISDVLDAVVEDNAFHPVRDYLNSLKWDKKNRLDSLFIDYLGVEDSELNRSITRKVFTAAVARIFEPGVKFDELAVLAGIEGCGKSTLLRKMGVDWFSDTFISPEDIKGAAEQIQGSWIIEVAELNGFKKAEEAAIKGFLSKQVDDYRPAYGKNKVYRSRQCIFIGTTNEDEFLKGISGDRRFWPMKVRVNTPIRSVWDDLDSAEVAQLWAEAYHFYKEGEPLQLPKNLESQLTEIKEGFTETDPWEDKINEFLETPVPENWKTADQEAILDFTNDSEDTVLRDRVNTRDLWVFALGGDLKQLDNLKKRRICNVMNRKKDWQWKQYSLKGVKLFGWMRK